MFWLIGLIVFAAGVYVSLNQEELEERFGFVTATEPVLMPRMEQIEEELEVEDELKVKRKKILALSKRLSEEGRNIALYDQVSGEIFEV